ncbi:hypothetical protein JCM11641_002407 [Rhodosporidiobolus odoratus]
MAVDFSDSRIAQAYQDLRSASPSVDWFVLAPQVPGNRLSLRHAGPGGLDELRGHLVDNEVQHGLLRLEGSLVSFSLVPNAVGGVRRARALVQARAFSSAFRLSNATLNATSRADFDSPSSIWTNLARSRPHSPSTPPMRYPPTSSSLSSPALSQPSYPRDQFASAPSSSFAQSGLRSPANNPLKPPSPLPNGFITDTSNVSIRSNSPKQQQASMPTQFPALADAPSAHGSHPASPPSIEHQSPLPQGFESGFPSHLGAPSASTYDATHSPTNGTAPHAFPSSRGPVSPSYNLDDSATSLSTSDPHTAPNPAAEWRRQTHYRASPPRTDGAVEASGLFDSAAAAMLAPHSPDATTTEFVISPPRPLFADPAAGSSSASLKPSVQSVPVDVVPDEDGQEDKAATAAAAVAARTQREEAARMQREEREREAEDRAREEAERSRLAQLEKEAEALARTEEEERRKEEEAAAALAVEERRLQEEAALFKAEEERIRAEEERRAWQESERLRLEQEELEREEAERLRLDEEERTRQAEEEMRLLIEQQRAEKKLREQEEIRRREEARVRQIEERRRALVEKREKGEVMLSGSVNAQGGNSMLWKRRHYQLSGSGLSLFKSAADLEHPLDHIQTSNILKIADEVEDALMPNSFAVRLKDDDEYLFYTDTKGDKEMLITGIKCAAKMA